MGSTTSSGVGMFFGSSLGQRSKAQMREDETFMLALKDIPTLQARDGHLSMEASDLQEQVDALHEAGKRLIAKQAR